MDTSIDRYLTRSGYSEKRIKLEEITSYFWDDLIQLTSDFLYDYEALYDELENLVNNQGVNPIIKTDPPEHTKSYANRQRNFIGGETDWGKKQSLTKALGNAGEDFVYKLERKKLIDHEIENYAELVQRKRDGEGYDILSADLNKNPIHIEVKTTARGKEEPFYFSLNEFEYLRLNPRNYFLYRLYNYVIEKNTCNYYVLTGLELLEWTFKEINFEVSKHYEIE